MMSLFDSLLKSLGGGQMPGMGQQGIAPTLQIPMAPQQQNPLSDFEQAYQTLMRGRQSGLGQSGLSKAGLQYGQAAPIQDTSLGGLMGMLNSMQPQQQAPRQAPTMPMHPSLMKLLGG